MHTVPVHVPVHVPVPGRSPGRVWGPLKERRDTFSENAALLGRPISLRRRWWSGGMIVLGFCCRRLALTCLPECSVVETGRECGGAAGNRGGGRGAAIGAVFLGPPFSKVPPGVWVIATHHNVHGLTDEGPVVQERREPSGEARYEAAEGLQQGGAPFFFAPPHAF